MTAQQVDAFLHAGQAMGPRRRQDGFRIETAALVLDLEAQALRGGPDPHGGGAHAGMAGDVRQGFLHDPVGRCLHLGRKAFLDPFVLELDLYTGLVGKSLEEREQGGQQPELIERGGTQVER